MVCDKFCFAAERTLGKLSKWLRMLGFDTLLQPRVGGEKFIENLENERIVLTRTQRIRKQFAHRKLIFIQSDQLMEQLKQVFGELGLNFAHLRPFSRCLQCNVLIVTADKDSVWGRVPDYIFETHDEFQTCPKCGNIFWPGSHISRSLKRIQQIFE